VIGTNFKFFDDSEKVQKAARRASYELVEKSAYRIWQGSRASIEKAPVIGGNKAGIKRDAKGHFVKGSGKKGKKKTIPSAPGTPPHTRRKQLPNAIIYDASRGNAMIGPRFSRVGLAGEAHEFGGRYKGGDYPERSYMGLALTKEATAFGASFAGSIGA
jgi:hypothetical protein